MFLNRDQIKMMLYLGDADEGSASGDVIDKGVFDSLVDLGLVHKESEGKFNFTNEGEQLYAKLDARRGSFPPEALS